jgi:hypothetical protein
MTAGNEEYKIEQKLLNNALQISIVDNRNNEYTGLFSKEFLSEKEDFLKYLSIKAIFEFFQNNINSKNYEIKNEDLIKLNLIIEYSPGKKIELLIPRKNLDENIQLNLITELTNIKKENKEIKEKLTYLEQKINILLQEKDKKDDLKGFENTIIKNNS